MVRGLDTFRNYFKGFEDQYILIGGAACDILFANNEGQFRATRDLDIVLIVEALTTEFGERFWDFIVKGKYRNKAANVGTPQFYRFDKPENELYPKMIELFAKTNFKLKEMNRLTPVHIDDEVSSLSAILLNDNYYQILLSGKVVVQELSVLRPEYLLLFKAKAYLDLKKRKENGGHVDSRDIKKHKNDILRIATEFIMEQIETLPEGIYTDIKEFLNMMETEPFEANLLREYSLSNEEVTSQLRWIYNLDAEPKTLPQAAGYHN